MNCPNCGKEMEKGFMHTQKYPFWTQQELRVFKAPTDQIDLGPLDDDDTSMFTRDPFPEFPGTELCRECGLVVFHCKMIDKSKK